jgi:hypothetical protein
MQNGAGFEVRRQDVNGKLENNLRLFMQSCIAQIPEKPALTSKSEMRERLRTIPRAVTNVYGRRSLPPLNLKDLDI